MRFPKTINRLRRWSWNFPRIYREVYKHRWNGVFLPDLYDVYICGFPRSGNNFLLETAKQLVGEEVSVSPASHLCPFILDSRRAGKPVILTLREPRRCIASWMVAKPCGAAEALEYYVDFHRFMMRRASGLRSAPFDELTRLEPAFIRGLMRELGVAEEGIPDGEALQQMAFEAIAARNPDEGRLNPMPHANRKAKQQAALEEVDHPRHAAALDRARAIHAEALEAFPSVARQGEPATAAR